MTPQSEASSHFFHKNKYGPILWIYIICEVCTASFQQSKLLKMQLDLLKLQNTPGENVKAFTTQFQQICLDLGQNVPSDTPFTLNKQLSTSSIEQFHIKFMAFSTKVSTWVTHIHGLTKVDIEAHAADPAYASVSMLLRRPTVSI